MPVTTNLTIPCAAFNSPTAVKKIATAASSPTVSQSSSIAIKKGVGKIISIASSSAATISQIRAKLISVVESTYCSVRSITSYLRTIPLTILSSTSLIRRVQVVKSITQASVVSALKRLTKTIALIATIVVLIGKVRPITLIAKVSSKLFMGRVFNISGLISLVSVTTVPSATKGLFKTVSATGGSIINIVKKTAKTISLAYAGTTGAGSRSILKTIAVVQGTYIVLNKSLAKLLIILVSQPPNVIINKTLGLTKSITSASIVSITKLPQLIKSVVSSTVVTNIKSIIRTISLSVSTYIAPINYQLSLKRTIQVPVSLTISAYKKMNVVVTATTNYIAKILKAWGLS
jgi:hypothetical protein